MGIILKSSGYALMAISMFLFSLCEALEKYLTSIYEPAHIIMYRSFIGLFFVAWVIFRKGIDAFKTDKILHCLRNLFAAGSLFLTIYSLKHLPLSSYGFMSFTSPIFISLFSYLFLSEKLSNSVIMPVILSFGGILIMFYPFADMSLNQGLVFAFLSSVLYASACVVTKRISHIDNLVLYASYIITCLLISSVFSVDNFNFRLNDIPIFILIAFVHFLAFQCLIFAYRKEELIRLSPLEYTTILWSIVLGFLLWHHIPSYKELIGGSLVIFGSLISKKKGLELLFLSKKIKSNP